MTMVDPEVFVGGGVADFVSRARGVASTWERRELGVWVGGHWNFPSVAFFAEGIAVAYPLDVRLPAELVDPFEGYVYGVCDSPEQFIDRWYPALAADDRMWCVSMVEIVRANESPGGWRWHKWGPYIGDHTPTAEYLADEPDIDRVFTCHLYEVA